MGGAGTVDHVVVDYGGVISEYQSPEAVAALSRAAAAVGGEDPALVGAVYWEHRLAYDRGDLDEAAYWSAVTGADLSPGDPRLAELVRLDVAGWSRTRPRSVEVLTDLAARGHRLALLSNTPRPHAEWMLSQPWSHLFAVHVFSYRARVAKPEAAVFEHTLERLGCAAGRAVFVDDRGENVRGARSVGMSAVLFEGEHSWDAVLQVLGRPPAA